MGLRESSIPTFKRSATSVCGFRRAKVEALLDALNQVDFDPNIIVVETLRRVLNGSENEAADVGSSGKAWDLSLLLERR